MRYCLLAVFECIVVYGQERATEVITRRISESALAVGFDVRVPRMLFMMSNWRRSAGASSGKTVAHVWSRPK